MREHSQKLSGDHLTHASSVLSSTRGDSASALHDVTRLKSSALCTLGFTYRPYISASSSFSSPNIFLRGPPVTQAKQSLTYTTSALEHACYRCTFTSNKCHNFVRYCREILGFVVSFHLPVHHPVVHASIWRQPRSGQSNTGLHPCSNRADIPFLLSS